MHLVVDGYCRNIELLQDSGKLSDWLVSVVEAVGMNQVSSPIIIEFPEELNALSGIIFLSESSIVVHTYPEFEFVFLDIFSCLSFDQDKVLELVKKSFGLTKYRKEVLDRGLNKEGKPYI